MHCIKKLLYEPDLCICFGEYRGGGGVAGKILHHLKTKPLHLIPGTEHMPIVKLSSLLAVGQPSVHFSISKGFVNIKDVFINDVLTVPVTYSEYESVHVLPKCFRL